MSATDAAEQRTTTDTVKALDGFCPARVGDLDLDVSPPINMGLLGLGPIPKPYGLADFLQGRPFPSPPPVAPLPPPVVPSLPDFDDIVRIVGGAALRVLKKKDRGRCSRHQPRRQSMRAQIEHFLESVSLGGAPEWWNWPPTHFCSALRKVRNFPVHDKTILRARDAVNRARTSEDS